MNLGNIWRLNHSNNIARAATLVLTTTTVFQSTHCFPIHSYYYSSSSSSSSSRGVRRMMSKLVDVDCNLQHDDLLQLSQQSTTKTNNDDDDDDDDDVAECFQLLYHPSIQHSNIGAMIVPSSTIQESQSMVSLLSQQPIINGIEIKTTVGVHPYHAQEDNLDQVSMLLDLLSQQHNIIRAIGECGLDYSDGFPDKLYQLPWFQKQVQLAIQYNLPLFIHERLAFHDLLQILDSYTNTNNDGELPPIVIHCFTGTVEECRHYISRGYYISISGFVLKKGSEEVQQCLREGIIPLDKLMIETDAPYMGFPSCRDTYNQYEDLSQFNSKQRKRIQKSIYPNVPTSLPQVLQATLDLLNQGRMARKEEEEEEPLLTYEQLATITTQNAKQFFNLDLDIDTTTTTAKEK